MNYATHREIFTPLLSGEHRRIFAGRESEESLKCILMPVAQLKSSAKDTVMRRTSHAKGSRNVDIQEQSKAKQSKAKLPSHHNDKEFKRCSDFCRNPLKVTSDVFSIYTFYYRKSLNIPVQNLKYFFLNFLSTVKLLKKPKQIYFCSIKHNSLDLGYHFYKH